MIKRLILAIGFILFFSFSASPADASIIYGAPEYYATPNIPYATSCSSSSGCLSVPYCWNSASVGSTDCGTACSGGSVWKQYSLTGCYQTGYSDFGDELCSTVFTLSASTCSTGDKYDFGTPPVLQAGYCNCDVGGEYKTCCNLGSHTLVNANYYSVDTINPPYEADCGGASTVYCGGGGQPDCGQDACGYACTPGACNAPTPVCGQTTYGSNGCSSCSKTGPDCPTGVCTKDAWKTICTKSRC